MMQLIIDIYEGTQQEPIIGHVFRGSRRMINAVIRAHMKTDSFFRAAMNGETWKGIPLRIDEQWEATNGE